jgi:nitrogen fixation/metabolism regulation signal transduction histidine kinase
MGLRRTITTWNRGQFLVFLLALVFAGILAVGAFTWWDHRQQEVLGAYEELFRTNTTMIEYALRTNNHAMAQDLMAQYRAMEAEWLNHMARYRNTRSLLRSLLLVALVFTVGFTLWITWTWASRDRTLGRTE